MSPKKGIEPDAADAPAPVTKTRLRRGEIRRHKPPRPPAEIVDLVPPIHGDIEEFLCDLSRDEKPE